MRATPRPGGLKLLPVAALGLPDAPLDGFELLPVLPLDARAAPRLPPLQLRALAALPLRDQVRV